jgi:dihydrolipoamide dehydrogenase
MTNREILDLMEVPADLVVVGGGVIGLEMASYYQSAGSNVTVIELLDHIAGNTDPEIAQILLKNYQKKGIRFLLSTKVTAIEDKAVVCESGGETLRVEADKVLMSIGRRAATEGLGLENIGVELERGRIKTDSRCQTNVPGVYAAGDVNGISMLAHTAYRESETAVNNMLGKKDIMRYHAIPSVIYTNPEVAGVGETEQTAAEKGIEFEVKKLPMMYSGRYMAENEGGDGICKILVDKEHKRLIGVHMIGNYSSEIIYGAALMIEMEMRVDDVKELVFPHPTVSEIIRETIFEF